MVTKIIIIKKGGSSRYRGGNTKWTGKKKGKKKARYGSAKKPYRNFKR